MEQATLSESRPITLAKCEQISGGESYGELLCEIIEEAEKPMKE